MIMIKRTISLLCILLLAVLLNGCTNRNQSVSSAPTASDTIIFRPAEVKTDEEINSAFDTALENATTTLEMAEAYNVYRAEWEKKVQAYVDSILSFARQTVSSNQVIDEMRPAELEQYILRRQTETDSRIAEENERFTQEQANAGGSIATINHAASLYEIQKKFSAELASLYEQIDA